LNLGLKLAIQAILPPEPLHQPQIVTFRVT
jgi:hypothetical protein